MMKAEIEAAKTALAALEKAGAQRAQVSLSFQEMTELNVESNQISLLRTTLDKNIQCKVVAHQKLGVASGNQWDPRSLDRLAEQALHTAEGSSVDAAYAVAGGQGSQEFSNDTLAKDTDWMYELLRDFLQSCRERFPAIIIEGAVVRFIHQKDVLLNNEGTCLQASQGSYDGYVVFISKKGAQCSSSNSCGFVLRRDGTPLIEHSGLQQLLQQSTEQIELQKMPFRGLGDILVTPHCLTGMLSDVFSYLQTPRLLRKSSFLQGHVGDRVATAELTIEARPRHDDFAIQNFWTSDGYVAGNETIIENGILRTYLVDDYGARKLKLPRSLSGGRQVVIRPGAVSLQQQIASIENGLLLCRFSSGNPSEAGDFSGVAKNSYSIKDGKLQFPVRETMVSGNYKELLQNIHSISRETVHLGTTQLPYIQIKNCTLS
jgi:PmbA protein